MGRGKGTGRAIGGEIVGAPRIGRNGGMQTHLIEGEAGIRRRIKRGRRIMAKRRIGGCTPRSPPLLKPRPSIPR